MRCGEHSAQKTPPQRLQWWRRRSSVKSRLQATQLSASASLSHSAATVTSVQAEPQAMRRMSFLDSVSSGRGP